MEAIFSRANRMMEIHHASQYTVSNSWCIWCIKIMVSALLKTKIKKKKNGWFERVNLFVLCWIGRSFFVSLSNQKHCYGELCVGVAVFFIQINQIK